MGDAGRASRGRVPAAVPGPRDGRAGRRAGWWFTGRHQALTEIADWLRVPDPARPGLVVTGGPGSGKTAVLGLVSTLADPERRRSVPLDTLNLPAAAIPPVDGLDVTIYAGALSTDQVLAGLAAAAHVQVESVADLAAGLAGRSTPFTALIDALDEATDPRHLVTRLLTPLLEHGNGRIRLLLGSRPHLLPLLGRSVGNPIGLDDDRYADEQALTAYTVRGLLEATTDSPYLHCDRTVDAAGRRRGRRRGGAIIPGRPDRERHARGRAAAGRSVRPGVAGRPAEVAGRRDARRPRTTTRPGRRPGA